MSSGEGHAWVHIAYECALKVGGWAASCVTKAGGWNCTGVSQLECFLVAPCQHTAHIKHGMTEQHKSDIVAQAPATATHISDFCLQKEIGHCQPQHNLSFWNLPKRHSTCHLHPTFVMSTPASVLQHSTRHEGTCTLPTRPNHCAVVEKCRIASFMPLWYKLLLYSCTLVSCSINS